MTGSELPRRLTEDVRYPGNFVKLVWDGVGEIELLAAAPLTPHRGIPVRVQGVNLCLEHPEEVVAKKLVFGATSPGTVKGRDIYDVHVCLGAGLIRPSNLAGVVGAERFDAVLEALKSMPTASWRKYASSCSARSIPTRTICVAASWTSRRRLRP